MRPNLILCAAIAALVAYCLFISGHKDGPDAARKYAQGITKIERRIDTLRITATKHDTLEKVLRARALHLVVHDTVHDTLRAEAIDTLESALGECDSSKADRDSIITRLDTVTKIVRDSAKAEDSHAKGYVITGLVTALITGAMCLFLLR